MGYTAIPLADTPAQSMALRLDGQPLRLTVRWSPTSATWLATLEAPPGSPIVTSRRLAVDEPLLGAAPSTFRGDFWLRSTDGTDAEPDEHAWGGSHTLIYQP